MKVKIFLNSSFVALDFKIVFVSFDDYFNSYFFLNSILTKYLLCGILPVNDASFVYFKLKFKNPKYHSLSRPISQTHYIFDEKALTYRHKAPLTALCLLCFNSTSMEKGTCLYE